MARAEYIQRVPTGEGTGSRAHACARRHARRIGIGGSERTYGGPVSIWCEVESEGAGDDRRLLTRTGAHTAPRAARRGVRAKHARSVAGRANSSASQPSVHHAISPRI